MKKENENKNNDNMFYLLTAPILLFKKMNLSKEILNKIEFIDFPGIDVNEPLIDDIFNKIVELTDTFVFVNECNLIKNKDNIKIMQRIVSRIESRRFNFDYNSCLFILNKADEDENKDNINMEKKKKEIEEILFGQGNNFSQNFDFFKRKNPEISVSIFSSLYYLEYILFQDNIQDFERYINEKLEVILEEKKDDLIEQLDDKIYCQLLTEFENYENREVLINDEYFLKLKSCLLNKKIDIEEIKNKSENLKNIINNYIIMVNNLEENQYYIESKISSLIIELEKKFRIAKKMTENQYKEKIKTFINTLQNIFRLLQQESLNKKL